MLPKILSSAMWLDLFFSLPRWTGSRAFPFPPEPCCYSASAEGKEPPQLRAALVVTSPQEPLQFVGACQRDVFHSSKQHRYYRPLPTVRQESLAIWDVMLRGQRKETTPLEGKEIKFSTKNSILGNQCRLGGSQLRYRQMQRFRIPPPTCSPGPATRGKPSRSCPRLPACAGRFLRTPRGP